MDRRHHVPRPSSTVVSLLLPVILILTAARTAIVSAVPSQPANPIIAIVTTPLSDCGTAPTAGWDISGGCVESYYVRWLEYSGVRVVPLVWNSSWHSRRRILESVNGVLFPGGDLTGNDLALYTSFASDIFNYALECNANADPFFMWGTCQGFQVMGMLAAQDPSVLKCIYKGTDPSMLPLTFTSYQPQSEMFGPSAEAPVDLIPILEHQNSTLNWHVCGINPHDNVNANFSSIFDIISTNVDINGLPFISSMESRKQNFFATQFHPERILFQFRTDVIQHTPDDIRVSQYLSMFVAGRLKRNRHAYASASVANAATVENYPIVSYGFGSELYWISSEAL